jgi:hypothetical protein
MSRTSTVWTIALIASCAALLTACAPSYPYRHAAAKSIDRAVQLECRSAFKTTDGDIRGASLNFDLTADQRTQFVSDIDRRYIDDPLRYPKHCKKAAYEEHDKYDLYYVEFDDAGQATDFANGTPYADSQLYLIEQRLQAEFKTGGPDRDLDIVVFTHGWHGTAKADDMYSIAFKAILMGIGDRIADLSPKPNKLANADEDVPGRRVVGIEIAWRGDSFYSPAIPGVSGSKNALNVLDRKTAAETLSIGSVQELLAFLHEFYLRHTCHGAPAPGTGGKPIDCNRVHLLSIGHSYGALINFRALIPRLESGLNVEPQKQVYGFGDMTILLNPAFEGARYRPLFENALARPCIYGPYVGDENPAPPAQCPDVRFETRPAESTAKDRFSRHHGKHPLPPEKADSGQVQIPSIVTIQSKGDTATGTFFPIFRSVTTLFQHTVSAQELQDKDYAIGWVPDFRTHTLALNSGPQNTCPDSGKLPLSFCPFPTGDARPAERPQSKARTKWLALSKEKSESAMPNYMPLWVLFADTQVMANHDDIWNPQIVDLISILFSDAYQQTQQMHGRYGQ